jgi:hypothetical protein
VFEALTLPESVGLRGEKSAKVQAFLGRKMNSVGRLGETDPLQQSMRVALSALAQRLEQAPSSN